MEKIKITADSTCDLNPELLQKHDIAICPLIINLGEKTLRDYPGIDAEIYQYYDRTKNTPKTAAVSVEEYQEFFRQNLPQDGALIHFNISDELSCTHKNAVTAAQSFSNVYVIDSRSLSTGTAVSMMRAVKLRDQGLPADQIAARVQATINQVQASFILKDLTYLHRGGRCSSTAKLLATALRLKPQIKLVDGKMIAGKKFIGNFEKCVQSYVTYTLDNYRNPELDYCFITHTQMDNPTIVDKIRQQILARYPFAHVVETIAGGTVTAHCGKNTIGILYGLNADA